MATDESATCTSLSDNGVANRTGTVAPSSQGFPPGNGILADAGQTMSEGEETLLFTATNV